MEVRGPMLFSVKPAVCCCVYLNSQEKIISVRGPNAVLCKTCSVLCVLEQPREDNFSAGPNAVLCKTCSVLCVLEQPREDNFSAGPNAVLCKTCSVLLCVLEQPREDNFSAGPNAVLCKTYSVLCVYLNIQEKIISVRGPMLFSVKPAVCCVCT
jgi:hypothetical protein